MVSKALDLLKSARENGITISVNEKGELQLKFAKGVHIEPQLLQDLKDNKELITNFLTDNKFKSKKIDAFENELLRVDRSNVKNIPLSFSQERLWFIDQLEGSVQYHLPTVLRLKGKLNRDALAFAFQNIVNRHEVLRTVFHERDGQAWQYIKEQDAFELDSIDGTRYEKDQNALSKLLEKLIRQPFDLSNDYMVRASLITLNQEEHLLVVTMHHISSDGWSLSIIVNEVAELYASFVEDRVPKMEPLKIQYADYAIWQRKYLQGEVLNKKLSSWKEKLSGTTPLQIPADFPRPIIQSTRGSTTGFYISRELTIALNEFSQKHEVTLFMTLLAAFKVLLYRYSGQKDICVGTPIAGRQYPEVEGLIGFFINTLVLRSEVDGSSSFTSLVKQIKATTMQAYENQEVPVEKIVELVVKERDMSRNPLFQVLFSLQNTPEVPELRLGEMTLFREKMTGNTSKLDISFYMSESADGLHGGAEYCTDLFNKQTIDQMIVHLRQLLSSIIESPHEKIDALSMLTKADEHRLIEQFNDTSEIYPKQKTIVDLFEEQAEQNAASVAVIFEDQVLTYQVLNERSNQLAHYLRKHGVTQETIVPLCIERGIDMLVGLLGILKAGAAYTPIDPEYPGDRINYMLIDTGASLAIGSKAARSKLQTIENLEIIELDRDWPVIGKESKKNLQTRSKSDSLAYVIYTSGSTGKPKGVMIEHRSVINLLMSISKQVQFVPESVFLSVTTFSFDICYLEFYMPLVSGATLIVVSRDVAMDGYKLSKSISDHRPSHMQGTPSTWQLLLEADWKNTESVTMLVGGEAVKESLKNQLTQIGNVYNVYGPTETTIWSASTKLEPDHKVVIGKPLANTSIYILSEGNQLCPPKVAGEICIGGDGLARGYLNRPDLTMEKFISDPFSKESGARLYRTGDLGRWLPDGNIEYISRLDDQVKIRGYRIELGEIESVLQQISTIKEAVVLAKEDINGNKRLVAYIVAEGSFDRDTSTAYLNSKLPEYMVPSIWVELESLPLTANGKINRKALPEPDTNELLRNEYIAPRTTTEHALAGIWQELLGIQTVGINDNFFQLGGHSLLAMRVISSIRKQLRIDIGIRDLFIHPTIAALSAHLQTQSPALLLPAIEVQARPDNILLSFSQERLWFIDRLEGSMQYHMHSVLRLKGKLNTPALEQALKSIVDRHEALRTIYKEHEGQPRQIIMDKGSWKLSMTQGFHYKTDSDGLRQLIKEIINHPFDLAKDYMLRADLVAIDPAEHLLVVTMHHIASDGWSLGIIVKEVTELYNAFNENRASDLKPLPLQYADFAIWQHKYLQGEILDKKLGYWKQKLEDTVPLQLPTDYPRPAIQSTRGSLQVFHVEKELADSIAALSQKYGSTLFMTLLAAFKVLLHRYSGQNDICVGTPIAGRQQQDLEGLIGFFVNTLALRSEVNSEVSFEELLQNIKATTLEAYENQEIPFEKVVDAVVKERDMGRSPLFQVMLVLQNTADIPEVNLGEVSLSGDRYQHTTAMFDLTFFIIEAEDGLRGRMEYCTDLFNESTIARMIAHFKELLSSIAKTPGQKIGKLPMLTRADEYQLLVKFNDTWEKYAEDKTIVDLFEEQAAKTPGSIAVVFEQDQLTYKQLNDRSNQVAHYIMTKGIGAESLVAVCMERSHQMIIAILGILKAGAAYLPVDPEYPEERITYMLQDTGTKLVISTSQSSPNIPFSDSFEIIELDGQWPLINNRASTNIQHNISGDHLAYVIYTSGSTGKPKGVMIEHRNVYSFINWCWQEFSQSRFEIVYAGTSMCFDLSVFEFFYPLTTGKRLRIIENGLYIGRYLPADRNVMINSVPSVVQSLIKEGADLSNITVMNMAGEPIPLQVQQGLDAGKIEIRNLYGPTEDTTYSTVFRLKNGEPVLIGKPISNSQIYIVNREMDLVPVGVAGEICIGGAGLARGYLNQPGLTAEKFIANPYNTEKGARLYKTGDLGRWLADGNIEYLGRLDHQVKIRGYRIELGEIESVLAQCEAVDEAVVLAREEREGPKKLIGYVVPDWQAIKAKEKELYYRQVANWKELYETEYEKTEEDENIDPEFNIIGWNDSFAGGPIGAGQMRDWLQDIVDLILLEKPGNVLEIGCGTGLIYYQLAGKVNKYIGTDFSRSSINQINHRINKGERNYGPTELQVCAAHEVSANDTQADTVIINSVIQYFPGEDYLTDVIGKSIALLKGKGRIVIGDVRDIRLLKLFKSRLLLQKLQDSVSIKELKWAADQEVLKEEELCFSPEYFYNLQSLYPQITHVQIQWKHSTYINELTLYRYNVVLYIGIQKEIVEPQWHSFNDADSEWILAQLEQGSRLIALRDVPNPRLSKERILHQSLEHNTAVTVGDLSAAIGKEDKERAAVQQLLDLAGAGNFRYNLLVNEDPLKVNIVLERGGSDYFIKDTYAHNGYKGNGLFTNIPLFTNISSLLQKEIRTLMQQRLPEYMVPSELIMLGHMPLTGNGKVDRKFLSEREDRSLANKLKYEAPRTPSEETLAIIWQELLGIDRIGIHDDFFELGGHSLLATRAVSAVRRKLNVELAIKDLFSHPTIARLTEHFGSQNRTSLPPIKPEPRDEYIPLSFSQERLWFIDRLEGSVQYHVPAVFRLKGKLDKAALEHSFRTIVNRHEVLRTVIHEQEGQPSQFIKEKNQWTLRYIDGSAFMHDDTRLKLYTDGLIKEPFDLSKDDMLRASLISIGEQEHVLVVAMHHIASDGWSLSIIVREIAELYEAYTQHRQPELTDVEVQYADYAIWQRRHIRGELLDKKMNYWKQKLEAVAALQLPTDYPRPALQSSRGDVVSFKVEKELLLKLQLLSQEQGTTLFMTLLTAFKVLLHHYSGQQDICVGTSIAGRQQQEIEGLIGFFINTLALRSAVNGTVSFTELLQQVKTTTLDAYENQEVPFEKVVDAIVTQRDMSRNPIFQVLFALQNTPDVPELKLGDLSLSPHGFEHTTAQFDLTFRITETAGGLQGGLEYCTDLFNEQTIERMVRHFNGLLHSIVKEPQQLVGTLSMLDEEEKNHLLFDFNNTSSPYPADKNIVSLFEEQAAKTPGGKAIVFEDEYLSYQQLNERSNQLARFLRKKGVTQETLVPICVERSLHMMVGILGILKAGGVYVPLDPKYPAERTGFMLNDTNANVAVSSRECISKLEHAAGPLDIIQLDEDWSVISEQSIDNLKINIPASQLAYIIYTSGSTGRPKGVMVEHRNVVSLVRGVDYVSFSRNDVLLSTGSFSFDATTFEYWGMLLNGGQLIICNENTLLSSSLLKNEIRERGVTKMWFTSSWFNQLVETDITLFEGLQTILAGGEKLSEQHIRQIRETYGAIEIINGYGPTENTTFSLTYKIKETEFTGAIPIGRPFSNRTAYILNDQHQPVPVGVAGEICLGGAGLSRGYLNQEELTKQKFIANPFSRDAAQRLYRTGDLGRWLPDGNIEYLGRFDDQVKIRGFRIELGEIESVLGQSGLVRQAVIVVNEDKEKNKRLVAYIVPEESFDREEIVFYLKAKLPEYMIPTLWVELQQFPLTPNGKVDKKALPAPDSNELVSNKTLVAPGTQTEQTLADIWKDLLEIDEVGIHDNFFELGGHSLLAIRLISLIRKETSAEVPIAYVFEHPTIAELAIFLESQSGIVAIPAIKANQRPERIPLSFSQQRLWFIDKLEGSVQYHIPAAFSLNGYLNKEALEKTLQAIVNRHEVLRTVFRYEDGQAWQHIKEKDGWRLTIVNRSDYDNNLQNLRTYIDKLIKQPFDLSKDDMLRAALITISDSEHILVVTMHHIASDGWSASILVKEVVELYKSYVEGRLPGLSPLEIQYADFAIWQQNYLQGEVLDQKMTYWKEKLDGVQPLELPTDFIRPAVWTARGTMASFSIEKSLSDQLQALSQQQGTTLFMTLLSALNVLLHRYSSQEDICIGSGIAGRQQQEVEGLIGFFVNTLALRNQVNDDAAFIELLQQVKTTTLGAYAHQEVPFEKIVDAVVTQRDMSRNPVFQVMFVLQNTPEIPELHLGEISLSRQSYEHTTAQFDLSFSITESASGMHGTVEYCTDLYTRDTIERIISHFKQLLLSIVATPSQRISELSIMAREEEHQLLDKFSGTEIDYPRDKAIVDLFEEQAHQSPDSIAVVFEEQEITYKDLRHRSNQLANYLLENGIQPGNNIGLLSLRGIEMIIATLGIVKAGCAYVPFNIEYPAERLHYIIEDARVTHIVCTNSELLPSRDLEQYQCIDIKESLSSSAQLPGVDAKVESCVYIMFTSGTTGRPKGIAVNHRNIIKLVYDAGSISVNREDRVLQWSNYSFDGSTYDIYCSLLKGACLHLIKDNWASDVNELSRVIKERNITVCFMTTALFNAIIEIQPNALKGLRKILFGGEMVSVSHVRKALEVLGPGKIIHVYGPTETTVYATHFNIDRVPQHGIIPIGKPLSNTRLFVLNANKKLVPIGVAGELYIGGEGVSMGYVNNDLLTAQKFLRNPVGDGELVVYRTGDKVRWLADGNIEFLGRFDDQVKIRGYRIELGEIESVLHQNELVRQAVVLAHLDGQGTKKLVAYILPANDFNREEMIRYLKEKLPEYMIPSLWVKMESLPLTPNGKIDKKALPDPDAGELLSNKYVAPRTELEVKLVELWQDLLKVERVGIEDNFFELGGHSLLAMRMVSYIERNLLISIPIQVLFKFTCISDLSKYLDIQAGKDSEEKNTTTFELFDV
jgi:amino acid adenylation domain-containing protein